MKRTLALLSLGALLTSGAAIAATGGNEGQKAPFTQNTPATGSVPSGTPSVSAQSTGAYQLRKARRAHTAGCNQPSSFKSERRRRQRQWRRQRCQRQRGGGTSR